GIRDDLVTGVQTCALPIFEAQQRYIRSSFFAGRSWSSLAAMTADAQAWCVQVAGQRRPRPLEGRTVAEAFAAEEAPALLPLPERSEERRVGEAGRGRRVRG